MFDSGCPRFGPGSAAPAGMLLGLDSGSGEVEALQEGKHENFGGKEGQDKNTDSLSHCELSERPPPWACGVSRGVRFTTGHRIFYLAQPDDGETQCISALHPAQKKQGSSVFRFRPGGCGGWPSTDVDRRRSWDIRHPRGGSEGVFFYL